MSSPQNPCLSRTHRARIYRCGLLLVSVLMAAGGCGLFNECAYQQARCQDGALELCDCDGAGGGQLFTGCKSPTRWEVLDWACATDDVCIEDQGGAVCVPESEGACVFPGYVAQCLADDTQRTCVTFIGAGVPQVGEGRPGVIATVPCRTGETCETGDDWAGCVTPVGG